eukprot:2821178-Pleurochrysis_carterae.AAC.1
MTVVRVVRVRKRAASPARERLVHRVLACRFVVTRFAGWRRTQSVLIRVGALRCVARGHGDLLTEVVVSQFGAITGR